MTSLSRKDKLDTQTIKIITLQPWCEASGKVIDVNEGECLIIFKGFTLRLPAMDLSFSQYVKRFLGQRVSIIRTDLVRAPYRLNPLTRVTKNSTAKPSSRARGISQARVAALEESYHGNAKQSSI